MESKHYQDAGSHQFQQVNQEHGYDKKFKQSYKCCRFPTHNSHLQTEDKIIMPVSAIYQLNALGIEYPMQFEIKNTAMGRASHCGVLEFTSEEGFISMPEWMMKNIGVSDGELVEVKSTKLKKGTYMKLQPHSKEFIELSNPKAVLESTLRKFSCLSIGDTIMINHNDKEFYIDILETKPNSGVSMIDTDCEVDFAPPLDYKEPKKLLNPVPTKQVPVNNVKEEPKEEPKFIPFTGGGRRLDGKPVNNVEAVASCSSMVADKQEVVTERETGGSTNSGSCRKSGKLVIGSSDEVQSPNLSKDVSGNKEEQKFQPFTGKKYTLRG